MKELISSASSFGNYPDHNLLDSMAADDQVSLLPIIRMAFPFLKFEMLQPFPPNEIAFSLQSMCSMAQTEDSIMQKDNEQSLPSSEDAHVQDCGLKSLRHSFIQNVDEDMQIDSPSTSGEANRFSNAEAVGWSKRQELLYAAQRAEHEDSSTTRDDKLSLSSSFTSGETDHQMNGVSNKTNLLCCPSAESSLLQQVVSKPSEGAAFPLGDIKRQRISSLSAGGLIDLNRCTLHKSLEQNDVHEEEEVSKLVDRDEDPGENFAFVDDERNSTSVFSQESKQGCIQKDSVIGNCFSNKSPGGSMLELKMGSDDATSAHVAGSTSLDCSMEEPKLKRCHRSNGKQWRCRNNAFPGSLYCELHHTYMSKYKCKRGFSSVEKLKPHIQRKKANIGSHMQMELQRCSGCPEKSGVERCHRSDGKLWRCSKRVILGSIYCENHHNYRKRKHKDESYVSAKNKPIVEEPQMWAVDNAANACSRVSSHENENVTGAKELEDKPLTELCEGLMCTIAQLHEGGCHKKAMEVVQMGEKDGLMSVMDGWKQNIIAHASFSITSPEGKKNVNGFGQSTERGSNKEALQAESGNTSYSQDANADGQGNQPRWAMQCCRNDGKQWRCSQPCMRDSTYCEYHQGYFQKVKAKDIKQAKVNKMENQEAHAEAFSHKFHNNRQAINHRHKQLTSSADSLHQNQQAQKETKQLTDERSWDLCCLKRCQRKDGKGWQCSLHAKQGYNYCEHHLAYLSKRKLQRLCTEENQLPTFEDNQKISTVIRLSPSPSPAATLSVLEQGMPGGDEPQLGSGVFGLASCRRACASDSLSSFKQEMSAVGEEPFTGNTAQLPTQNKVMKTNIRQLEDSTQYSGGIISHDEHSGKGSATVEVATTAQESTSGSTIVHRGVQKQKVVLMGCVKEVKDSARRKFDVKTSFFEVSPSETREHSDGVMPGFVAIRNSLQEKPKWEQCHRTNGKQWRCSKNAVPGTLYCKLHHAHGKLKLHAIPGNEFQSCVQRDKFQTSNNSTQVKLQRLADCCLDQKGVVQEDEQLDAEQCCRNDGRFWQCSKQVMPGCTNCQNYPKQHMMSMKQQRENFLLAGNSKPDMEERQVSALDNGAILGSGESFFKHEGFSGLKEDRNGLHQSSIQERNLEKSVSEMCGRSSPTSMDSHEDGCKSHADGSTDDTVCLAGLVVHKEQLHKETNNKNLQIVCSSKRSQNKDGKHGQSLQHANQGSSHCECHGAYASKCNLPELFMEKDKLTIEDNREMSTADGPSCRKACFSATSPLHP